MLILRRRTGEALCIGQDVRITVLRIRAGEVRIGIKAPKSIPVHREELRQRIERERQETD